MSNLKPSKLLQIETRGRTSGLVAVQGIWIYFLAGDRNISSIMIQQQLHVVNNGYEGERRQITGDCNVTASSSLTEQRKYLLT